MNKKKEEKKTRSLAAGCQCPFLSNGSCLNAFIHASLGSLYLIAPGKVCKINGGLDSRQSTFFLPLASGLCSVQVFFPFINFINVT